MKMESFLVAVNVVLPMAMMMGIGAILRMTKVTTRETMKQVDKIIFNLFMPALMFYNIYQTDFHQSGAGNLLLYSLVGLGLVFLVALFLPPRVEKNRATAAALGQAILRPNYILFGVAVAQSLYGDEGVGTLILLGAVAVPVFNALSAVILEIGRAGHPKPAALLVAVFKNPMIVAALLGLTINFSGFRFPAMIEGVISDLVDITTPLSFLSLGVSFRLGDFAAKRKPLTIGLVTRLVLVPLAMVIPAILLGFRKTELCAIMALFAAPTAVASYPMAVAMDADGDMAAQMVALSTLLSLVTIFLWTLCLNGMGLL